MMIDYRLFTDRNIGLLSEDEQQQLKNSHIAVFGVGGLGGVIAEVLVRSGIGTITLIDRDVFEPTNLNRQIYAFTDTIGQRKIDVAEAFLRRINTELIVYKDTAVNEANINRLMNGVNVALLALDDIVPCILISRFAYSHNIPVVEGWAIPFGNVRVFTSETPTLEEVYKMPTISKDVSCITDAERRELNLKMLYALQSIEGISDYYSEFALQRINQGTITSFAPMVWLTAVLMAAESLKLILSKGNFALSPAFNLYDPYKNSIPNQYADENN
jgi:molybdopterin/thiamine biosynthesis adenylyltransferase